MFQKVTTIYSLVLLFAGLLFTPAFTHAQEDSLRIVTSPLPISLVTEPGTSISTELKVKNAGTEPETLKIDILKFSAYEDTGKPELADLEPTDEFVKWVTFSEPTFTALPEEWKTVTATFNVPKEASFGYYYAFVFTRVKDQGDLAPQQTAVVGGTATLVLLEARIPGAKREITVTEFSTDKTVYEFLPVNFTVSLKNAGNVHVAPRGNIFLSQGSNKDIALLELNPGKGSILPESTRVFDTDWADGFPVYEETIENGQVVLDETGAQTYRLTWDFKNASKLRFGKYTATMLLIYDDGTRDIPIEGVVSFWVMPWRLIVGAFFIAIFFLIGMKSTLSKIWRRLFSGSKEPVT
ncbi:MAG: hypothetical protein WAT81_05150 [Candidatus Moraniibacteriota bacterium]